MKNVIENLPWDTKFFKRKIARLNRNSFRANELRTVFAECKVRNIECLYARVTQSRRNVALAKRFRFTPVGTRVTYELRSSRTGKNAIGKTIPLASKRDHAAILRLAEGLSEESRFSRDRRFGKAAARALYRRKWAQKFLTDAPKTSCVVVARERGRVAGFVASSAKNRVVHIELVMVDASFRGQGIGGALMDATIITYRKKGYIHFRVVTQGTNLPARKLYESRGFLPKRSELDYHKWFI